MLSVSTEQWGCSSLCLASAPYLRPILSSALGLKPLFDATNALHDVREGRAQQLGGSYPREIEPLAGEINALISANRSVVERARTQVGNLAHALKSPLAVISNELRSANDPTSTLVAEQAGLMKSQVQTYLDRARIAAQRNVITANTPVVPVLEKLLRVMKKLSPDISFELQKSDYAVAFRGEEQDLEEVLGNLMENASRFAKARVVIDLNGSAEDKSSPSQFSIAVSDDGPGLSKPDRLRALKRGTRLDESQPGSGLGLSIVSDVVSEYGGRFELNESQMGGFEGDRFFAKNKVTSGERVSCEVKGIQHGHSSPVINPVVRAFIADGLQPYHVKKTWAFRWANRISSACFSV